MTKVVSKIQDFVKLESAAGLILMLAAAFAIAANNTFFSHWYSGLLSTPMAIQVSTLEIAKPLLLWINDGLMAVFFLLVGLEIKREVLEGELSSFDKAVLPMLAAIGGMVGPALIYVALNSADPVSLRGWAIPAATDIAFALGILALLGTRAPVALKIFLLAIAIIDDLGAILIIAMFYTEQLSVQALGLAGLGFAGLMIMNRMGVKRIAPYILVGLFIWVCVLKSGVHATLAGVLTALAIPLAPRKETGQSPLHKLEHGLHPWVAYMILPVFAFANAGVDLRGISLDALTGPVPLGIALGLFLGKQLGVFGLTFAAVKSGIARLPSGVNWLQIYGVACLTGVGFTMSLFIGGLAFSGAAELDQVRLGVLMGSIASGLLGYAVLRLAGQKEPKSAVGRTVPATV
ncbi:MAG: Na+/H+ antiporter NhaA [Alphaproteobacteria bacterium]|nr:Na+/H+ antiporter NhaA [Alphaproteobacteria bacterium]|tara:strand:+ start:9606 stop:10817 length:1212 start_codon:yes stop_codon:yes gene_type:complete